MIPQAFQLHEPMINKTQTHHLLALTFKQQNGFPKRKLPGATYFSSFACRLSVGSHPPPHPSPDLENPDMHTPKHSQSLSPPFYPRGQTWRSWLMTEACPGKTLRSAPFTRPSPAPEPGIHLANMSPNFTTVTTDSSSPCVQLLLSVGE